MTRALIGLVVVVIAAALLGGCSGGAPPAANYVLVYLKTGPATPTAEQSAEVFKGHMANMRRLADEKKLIIAGPFARPRDRSWRGLFLFDTSSIDAAREWAATDPGMPAGVFVAEFRSLRASTVLRRLSEFEKQLPKAEPKPTEPPLNVRAYVMVTADDADRAAKAIANSPFAGRTVWCARFRDSGGGVFVLDVAKADEVASALPDDGVDGWWSTISLMRLAPEAKTLP